MKSVKLGQTLFVYKIFSERGRNSFSRKRTPEYFFFFSGLFKESRHVDCADSEGNANDPELCDDSKKPEAVRECESENEEVTNITKTIFLNLIPFLRSARIFGLLHNGVFVHQNARM